MGVSGRPKLPAIFHSAGVGSEWHHRRAVACAVVEHCYGSQVADRVAAISVWGDLVGSLVTVAVDLPRPDLVGSSAAVGGKFGSAGRGNIMPIYECQVKRAASVSTGYSCPLATYQFLRQLAVIMDLS